MKKLKRFLTLEWWQSLTISDLPRGGAGRFVRGNGPNTGPSYESIAIGDVEDLGDELDDKVSLSEIDVSDPSWQEGEERLLLTQKEDGEAKFRGAAQLIDLFAPPGVEISLSDQAGWENETKTLTGNNFFGQLGRTGQLRILPDGTICHCIASTNGSESSSNGSATYRRNRAVDCLDPINNVQDSNVCDLLNPARTGGNTDDGWDLVNHTKSISIPARWGTWWKDTGGYTYFCFAVSGAVTLWWRTGTPEAIYRYISSITHPNLTENLLEHDFSDGPYEDQSGDETTVHDQVFYDSGSRRTFVKRAVGIWEEGNSDAVIWDDITGKPTAFPPSAHTHEIEDITGLQDELDGKLEKVLPSNTGAISANNGQNRIPFYTSASSWATGGLKVQAASEGTTIVLRDPDGTYEAEAGTSGKRVVNYNQLSGRVLANTAITPGTATKITYDAKGLVTGGSSLAASDIPDLPASKITSGTNTAFNKNFGTAADTAAEGNHNHSGVYEPVVTSGTTGQYYRGDKTWQTLDKDTVGLGYVDNTSDMVKPVSNATQAELDIRPFDVVRDYSKVANLTSSEEDLFSVAIQSSALQASHIAFEGNSTVSSGSILIKVNGATVWGMSITSVSTYVAHVEMYSVDGFVNFIIKVGIGLATSSTVIESLIETGDPVVVGIGSTAAVGGVILRKRVIQTANVFL